MAKHERRIPLLRLLARLGWQRDPDLWTIPCRDGQGHRAWLGIRLTSTGVNLTASSPGPWALQPLHAGQLRGALRDALLTVDDLAGSGSYDVAPGHGARNSGADGIPEPRRRACLDRRGSLSTSGTAPRAANPATPSSEVNDDHDDAKYSHSRSRPGVAA
jgi:hypothetical protein